MRRNATLRGGVGVGLAWLLIGAAAGGTRARAQTPEAWIGTRVVLKQGTDLKTEDHAGAIRPGRALFRVDRVQNEWLWVVADRIDGWVKPGDVVPLDRAVDYCTAALADDPRGGWAYALRGVLYEDMKEPDIALADYNEALRLDPDDAELLVRRGRIRSGRKRDHDRAIADFTAALRLDPKLARAYSGRGAAYQARQEPEKANDDFTAALRLDPKDVAALQGRALACLAKGESDRAIADLDEVVRLDPTDPVALVNRGNAWTAKHEYDHAIADYGAALHLDRNLVLAYNNRGIAYRAKQDYDRAISDHNVALRIDPKNPGAYLARGLAWKKMREFGRALADFSAALRHDPKLVDAYNGRAWLLATCPDDRYRNGKAAYAAALRACELTQWRDPGCLDSLAAAYAESRDFRHAVEWEQKAIAAATDDPRKTDFQVRLFLYQNKKPFRDTPPDPETREAAR